MPLNPYDDPGPWGAIYVGPELLPGIVISVDGAERPELWDFQKGTASSNAVSVWKGTELAKAIKIVLEAPTRESFARLYVIRDLLRPKGGTLPPSLSIVNGAINFNEITRISTALIGQPKPAPNLSWRIELTLCEYSPSKPAKAGPASSNVRSGSKKVETENDRLAAQLGAAVKAASVAGNP